MMTDDREILKYLLEHPQEPADEAWVRSMELKYPYFSLPGLLRLRARAAAGSTDSSYDDELGKLLLTGSAGAARLADPELADESTFYPGQPRKSTPSTTSTIDTFLATYGSADPTETATLERMIFNPVADYSQTLARQEQKPLPEATPTGNSRDDMINRFILSHQGSALDDDASPQAQPEPGTAPETPSRRQAKKATQERQHKGAATPPDNSLLSESLAKIFIKSRRYERAYEILANLSLAFPEKSAYFADQMRFLRKLMLNEQYRRKRQQDSPE
ncbi:MAG: hypothetical protein K2K36_04615 [Muribaculaceae bacterium]|nr:hypothetical protein [Muribaculaceae bacterium]